MILGVKGLMCILQSRKNQYAPWKYVSENGYDRKSLRQKQKAAPQEPILLRETRRPFEWFLLLPVKILKPYTTLSGDVNLPVTALLFMYFLNQLTTPQKVQHIIQLTTFESTKGLSFIDKQHRSHISITTNKLRWTFDWTIHCLGGSGFSKHTVTKCNNITTQVFRISDK